MEAFSDRDDLVFVINQFNYLEHLLTGILLTYIDPKEEKVSFVRNYLLNNAIVPFSSKVKLFLHLNSTENWVKIDKNVFHRIMQIRNQFAHSGKEILEIDTSEPENSEVHLFLESVQGNGKLEQVKAKTALNEFTQHYIYLDKKLSAIHAILSKKSG